MKQSVDHAMAEHHRTEDDEGGEAEGEQQPEYVDRAHYAARSCSAGGDAGDRLSTDAQAPTG